MKKESFYLLTFIVGVFVVSFFARSWLVSEPAPAGESHPSYQRIVSLAPSITECLFAVGAGDQMVGVTNYCEYPEEANSLTKVGGHYDLNYETLISLKPDLVVCLPSSPEIHQRLRALDIEVMPVESSSVSGIMQSLIQLGEKTGNLAEAEKVVADMEMRIAKVKAQRVDQPSRKILVSIGQNTGEAAVQNLFIAGRNNFYDDLITLLGCENVYAGEVAYPAVSHEGLIRMNPEVIFEMTPEDELENSIQLERVWKRQTLLDAVKLDNVFVLAGDYVVKPGPRVVDLLELMAEKMKISR